LRLLVYEYLCGGGCAGQAFQTDVLCEGYAMLRALIADLKMLGHYITTFLDSRMMKFNPPLQADEIFPVSSRDDVCKMLRGTCRNVDAVYIIAPESNGILRKIVEDVEELGGVTINCSPESIEASSNKLNVYETLKRIGIAVPKNIPVNVQEDIKRIKSLAKELGFPLVFKPNVGVGSGGLSIVEDEGEISMAVQKVKDASSEGFFLIQQFVKGAPASVSLVCDSECVLPLTLNAQLLKLASPKSNSSYEGGIVPFHHPQEGEAIKAAQSTVKCFKGLRGYVGVDLVLTSRGPVVIEVNPRLTTSYVGLRKVLGFNPASAILNSVMKGELPKKAEALGYAFLFKAKVNSPKVEVLRRVYALEDVFSPPFPLGTESCAFIVSSSEELEGARFKAYEVKGKLEAICGV
jgi:predicted ATP-grasp superfamily ATP-dependent carboligase